MTNYYCYITISFKKDTNEEEVRRIAMLWKILIFQRGDFSLQKKKVDIDTCILPFYMAVKSGPVLKNTELSHKRY